MPVKPLLAKALCSTVAAGIVKVMLVSTLLNQWPFVSSETLVHLSDPEEINSFTLFSLDVPDEWVTELTLDALPADWNNIVPPPALKQLGNGWLTCR